MSQERHLVERFVNAFFLFFKVSGSQTNMKTIPTEWLCPGESLAEGWQLGTSQ